jgi:hypothetical protein
MSALPPKANIHYGSASGRYHHAERQLAIWPKSHAQPAERFPMNDSIPSFSERPFLERVDLRIAFHKVKDVFETCRKLKDADKEMLLQEISKQLTQLMPPSPATAGFAIRCLELAAAAPNDKIRNALLTIAQISEAEDDDADGRA